MYIQIRLCVYFQFERLELIRRPTVCTVSFSRACMSSRRPWGQSCQIEDVKLEPAYSLLPRICPSLSAVSPEALQYPWAAWKCITSTHRKSCHFGDGITMSTIQGGEAMETRIPPWAGTIHEPEGVPTEVTTGPGIHSWICLWTHLLCCICSQTPGAETTITAPSGEACPAAASLTHSLLQV